MKTEGKRIDQKLFLKNIELKLKEPSFLDDIRPLLSKGMRKAHSLSTEANTFMETEDNKTEEWDLFEAAEKIKNEMLVHLPSRQ